MVFQIIAIILCFFYTACTTMVPLEPVATLLQCHDYKNSSDSIINGQQVGYGDPDQKIVLQLQMRHKNHDSVCTGTLISERVILTAAHCVNNVDVDDIMAQFITTEGCPINQIREMRREITSMIIHKSFDGTPQSLSDLALLYLEENAPTEQQRLPVLSPLKKITNDKLLLIGYGITGETKKDSQTLRRIYKDLKADITSKDKALIVNQLNSSGGFCRGDSGAPIIGEIWGEPYIIAVNSANVGLKPNTECHTMSLAMDMNHFSDWVERNKKKIESRTWIDKIIEDSTLRLD